MKKTRAMVACAALAVTVAACGDDDDASGDAALSTVEPAPEATPADVAADTAAEASDDVIADCEAFEAVIREQSDVEPPEMGDEISGEFEDSIRSIVDDFEGLDLSSDEGESARDSFVDDLNTLADADTMTEELQTLGQSDAVATFGALCATALVDQ